MCKKKMQMQIKKLNCKNKHIFGRILDVMDLPVALKPQQSQAKKERIFKSHSNIGKRMHSRALSQIMTKLRQTFCDFAFCCFLGLSATKSKMSAL